MEKSDIEMLKKMSEALDEFVNAWDKVNELWQDSNVSRIMEREGELYPLDRSFDEILPEIEDWAYLASNELKKQAVMEQQWEKIMQSEVSIDELEWIIDAIKTRCNHMFHE